MDLRVNHEEINNFYDLSQNESDLIKENINIWIQKIEELKEIWQGTDAEEFYENATNYFKRLNIVPEFYDSLNNFVLEANRKYRETDNESKKEFEKISDEVGDNIV